MKKCSVCLQDKPPAAFHARKTSPDGLQPLCAAGQKVKTRQYYLRNKARLIAYSEEYRRRRPEVRKKAIANYSRKHAARISEAGRRYRTANPEKRAETQRKWREANPHKVNAYGARYRSDRAQRTVLHNPELLALVEAEMFEQAMLLSRETGIPHEVDHVVPLRGRTVCGLHNEHNLQVVPKAVNRSKSNIHWPDMP